MLPETLQQPLLDSDLRVIFVGYLSTLYDDGEVDRNARWVSLLVVVLLSVDDVAHSGEGCPFERPFSVSFVGSRSPLCEPKAASEHVL